MAVPDGWQAIEGCDCVRCCCCKTVLKWPDTITVHFFDPRIGADWDLTLTSIFRDFLGDGTYSEPYKHLCQYLAADEDGYPVACGVLAFDGHVPDFPDIPQTYFLVGMSLSCGCSETQVGTCATAEAVPGWYCFWSGGFTFSPTCNGPGDTNYQTYLINQPLPTSLQGPCDPSTYTCCPFHIRFYLINATGDTDIDDTTPYIDFTGDTTC